MEEWGYIDERELQVESGVVCMTCQHFIAASTSTATRWSAATREQPQQGQHLECCKLWAPAWQKEVGWAPEAG